MCVCVCIVRFIELYVLACFAPHFLNSSFLHLFFPADPPARGCADAWRSQPARCSTKGSRQRPRPLREGQAGVCVVRALIQGAPVLVHLPDQAPEPWPVSIQKKKQSFLSSFDFIFVCKNSCMHEWSTQAMYLCLYFPNYYQLKAFLHIHFLYFFCRAATGFALLHMPSMPELKAHKDAAKDFVKRCV